jgi:hypothetical protein
MKRKRPIQIGLRTATHKEILDLTVKYTELGYFVQHITYNLPHNGVLRCT